MSSHVAANTWQQNPDDLIVLVNRSQKNFILDMPSGRCRLDAGRRIQTLRSILKLQQVQELVDRGDLGIE